MPLPGTDGEGVTQGIDGLLDRAKKYKEAGAQFANWRAVLKISDNTPSGLFTFGFADVLLLYFHALVVYKCCTIFLSSCQCTACPAN